MSIVTSNQAKDLYDYWHLEYKGDLSLQDYMQNITEWTDMELDYWLLTGKIPGDGCEGPDKDKEVF